jgi:hypothetical protein
MTAPIVNSSSIPLTGSTVITQGCEQGWAESAAAAAADSINPSSRPGFFLLDLRSQSPPDPAPEVASDSGMSGDELPTGGNFLPLFLLAALPQQPEPVVLPPGVGTGSASGAGMPVGDATAVAPASDDGLPTRRTGVFDPLLRTSHRILDLLRLNASVTTDPISAPATPPAAPAPDDAGQLLKPALNAAAAVAQAAPDLLAAWLKRMTPTHKAPDAPATSQDAATDGPKVQRMDLPTAAQPPTGHAIKQLIDSLPAQVVTNQQSGEPKDASASPSIDLPSAPLFVDGHALRGHATAAQPDTSAQTLRLDVPMRSPEWAQALGERITWLVDQKLSAAEIKLNPPQLGPIEVRIALSADSTQVSVLAHNAITREALEAAAPRLREALTSHGFGSVSVDISQQSFADRPMAQSPMQRWESWQALAPDSGADDRMPAARWQSRGQLDAYA